MTNGEIRVSGPDQAKYEARVAAAIRYGKVPEGKQLVAEGDRWSREYVIRLQEAPAWLHAPLDPIPVPATLRKPHPVVIALQAGKRLNGIDRSGSHRALLLVQALAVEARRRGYSVKETKVTTNPYGFEHRESKDHFSITIGQYSVGVQLRQPMNRARHEATPAEQAKATKDRWYDIPKFDVTPSDRLSIQLSGRFKHRQSKWTDGRTGTLENWLPQILQEVELRAEAAEHARLAAIAAAAERRRQWECAMEKAKGDYAEAYRADVLLRQVDGWLRARQYATTSTSCRRPSTASPTPMRPSPPRSGTGGPRSGWRQLTRSDSPWRCPRCPNRSPTISSLSSRAGTPTDQSVRVGEGPTSLPPWHLAGNSAGRSGRTGPWCQTKPVGQAVA